MESKADQSAFSGAAILERRRRNDDRGIIRANRPSSDSQVSAMLHSLAYRSRTVRPIAMLVVSFLVSVLTMLTMAEQGYCAQAQQRALSPDFRQLLQKLANFSPDICGADADVGDPSDAEYRLFAKAAEILVSELNATPASAVAAHERANALLKKLEQVSAEVNGAWPDENRFHFEILDVPPALIVKMTILTQERFFVFAIPQDDSGKPNRLWQHVGSDEEYSERNGRNSSLTLYPLHRSASGNARFLAKFIISGCAGPLGVAYYAYEWGPSDRGSFEQIIKESGAFGLDDKTPGFEQIGTLRTSGSLITLPYCRFSGIDTWDNPSLCMVDAYDLSANDVRFRSRAYNRPDLAPIAKAMEYGQQRDYLAVRGYCASSEVARQIVRDLPPHVFAEDLRVTRTGKDKERVELGYSRTYSFKVEKISGRWQVVAFSVR
jgi:hypothetical protein